MKNLKIAEKLSNPFRYVAGGRALAWGLGVILLEAGWLCWLGLYQNSYLHFGPAAGEMRWARTIAMQLAMWLIPALLLWGCGALLSASKIRAVDILGTTALAQAPLLLLLLPLGIGGVAEWLDRTAGQAAAGVVPETGTVVLLLLYGVYSLVALALFFFRNYQAYAVSCNLRGWRAVVSYMAVVLALTAVSQVVHW